MADVFDAYTFSQAWDEMFEAPGMPRRAYERVFQALEHLDPDDLRFRAELVARAFTDRGVTFALGGEERPFPLDLVPRVIAAAEWDVIDRGVRQRVRALEAFLADVYGPQTIIAEGIVPRSVLLTGGGFHRAAHGIDPANGVRVHVAGIDLVRDVDGRFRVLEDNARVPSGVSYVIENRGIMAHAFPGLFAEHRIRPVDDYPARLLAALRAAAPPGVRDPVVVVLTPGVGNSAYFEHALLARQMGVELVEGRDLSCSGNRVRMRTTAGEQPVHVVYRRIDDEYLDPLHFRPESVIGCPGILNAARAGAVTIANAVGCGAADDKLIYTYVPDFIRFYLNEEPVLENVRTYRLDDAERLAWVLDSLDELVLKPVDGAGGKGIVIGPQADEKTLAKLRSTVAAGPRGWIAQVPVALSTSPTFVGDRFAPRHIDLRPFAVNSGDDIWVLPGGLTRVALPEGALVVNSSQGGGSKDTWVLADARRPVARTEDDAEQQAPPPSVVREAVADRQAGPGLAESAYQLQQ
ncbi:MAG: circularly permuted type 2 ATP-grasp protein [Catenulispora sp.]|nr:circularly permuted type 2 ATP-grasp protein [Catenulispora sp.]